MAIDERARHHLYQRLEEHLGAEAASTLMEHLPPVGWADVATKRDLDQSTTLLKADLVVLEERFEKSIERARADVLKTMSTHTIAIVFTMVATILAGIFAVAQMS